MHAHVMGPPSTLLGPTSRDPPTVGLERAAETTCGKMGPEGLKLPQLGVRGVRGGGVWGFQEIQGGLTWWYPAKST